MSVTMSAVAEGRGAARRRVSSDDDLEVDGLTLPPGRCSSHSRAGRAVRDLDYRPVKVWRGNASIVIRAVAERECSVRLVVRTTAP